MTAMSFADSMNSLDAMNTDDVVINQVRLPSFALVLNKIASLFKSQRHQDLTTTASHPQNFGQQL